MIRLLLYVLVAYLAYRFFKSFAGNLLKPRDESANDTMTEETELIRDPHCGTYFLKQSGVKAKIDGKQVYFCSTSCRDAYLLERQNR
jgi:YHS domain-containing protein